MKIALAAIVAATLASAPAYAAPKITIQPLQMADESIRYSHGLATVDQFSDSGSVQLRPSNLDHGSLAFYVAVFNDGEQPANIDVTNFALTAGQMTVAGMSAATLQSKAENRARWAQVGLALAGGLAATAAASQRDVYRGKLVTPHGVYRSYYSTPSAFGQVQAVATVAATGLGVAHIQQRLDETLDRLGNEILQTSTVAPGDSYGGLVIFEKVKLAKMPMRIDIIVDWNGRKYPFAFQVAKPGTPIPPFKPSAADIAPKEPKVITVPAPTIQPTPVVVMPSTSPR